MCRGEFDENFVEPLQRWVDSTLIVWLTVIISPSLSGEAEAPEPKASVSVAHWRDRLVAWVLEALCKLRIEEM